MVFLYLLFPSDLIKEIMVERLEQNQPNVAVQTDTIGLSILPPGVRFEPFAVSYAGKPCVDSDIFKVRPHLLSLIKDTKVFSFNGPVGSGRLSGQAELTQTPKHGQRLVFRNADLADVPLEAIAFFKQWKQYTPSGSIDGEISYNTLKSGRGRFDANFTVSPIRIVIDPPQVGLKSLEFTELVAEISANERQLTIKKCEAFGAQLEGKITGFIALRQPFGNSRPTLSLTIKPQQAFIDDHKNDIIGGLLSSSKAQKRGIVFQISGTLDNPSYVIR